MNRIDTIGRVSRLVSNNVTMDVYGRKTYKLKSCTCCNQLKVYSDFYVKQNKQHIHPSQLVANDLRDYCISCYDEKNKTYNKGSRPPAEVGNTLESFI